MATSSGVTSGTISGKTSGAVSGWFSGKASRTASTWGNSTGGTLSGSGSNSAKSIKLLSKIAGSSGTDPASESGESTVLSIGLKSSIAMDC